jgi:hypothetical protein
MAKGVKTGGRTKGTPNKSTKAFKEAVEIAFSELGGVNGLIEWAKTNPDAFYNGIFPKLAPLQIHHSGDDTKPPVRIEHGIAGQRVKSLLEQIATK